MRKAFLLVIATLSISACSLLYRQPVYQGNLLEQKSVEQLKEGMSQQQVFSLLGSPSVADPFHKSRWDYVASQRHRYHKIEVKTLSLWFDNGSLSKWEGEYFPEQDSDLAKEMGRFGNLPKDKDKDKHRSN